MNRFKFRVFSTCDSPYVEKGEKGFMFYQQVIEDEDEVPELWFVMEGCSDVRYHFEGIFLDSLEKDSCWKIMQFTGLHDKKGKEIYEGDIISDKEELWKVIFYKAGYWAKFIGGKEGIVPLDWRTETGKIIGNIYENPELLKGA